ncbi:MAG TPA: hypothetical protein VHR65_06910, partial [Solirubrobacterales bacterium]|nr:hypothetical protein [Solirubrobacterales bacterium]
GFTQYIIKHNVFVPGVIEEPLAEIKRLRVDLEPGFTVNPQATEQCPLETFEADETNCPAESIVGQEEATVALKIEIPNPKAPPPTLPKNFVIGPSEELETLVPLYNIVPKVGEPALFGFKIGSAKDEVFLETEVEWESNYHESFTIVTPPVSPVFRTLKSRLVSFGRSGNGTYLTNSPTCFSTELPPHEQAYTTFLRAESEEESIPSFPDGLTKVAATTTLPPGTVHTGCAKVPFDPELEVLPGATQVDSPAGPTVNTEAPFLEDPTGQAESQLRDAEVSLPQGMGLNPSGANGLQSCTDAQFHKSSRANTECPAASRIGTVEIETPPLPAGALKGNMYLGQQLSRDPTSGNEFRFFVDAESARYGIKVRLEGKTMADPVTGRLTTVLTENPQVPFESVKLQFDGAKSLLTSPPICASAETTSSFEPWSTPASTRAPTSSFKLTGAPGGGPCSATLAGRPFVPAYTAKTDSTKANAYSPFRVHIGRTDGQQELKRVDVTLPKGHAGNLTGIPYCPESALVSAAASSGASEQATPSCPVASQIGTASTLNGTGANPLSIGGKAYLAGPYRGAPLSLAVVTPAVAGPFDLGTVVVRVALFVDPVTAQVHAVSDTIPDVFGGVKLDIRSIDVNVDRSMFMHNPTNCAAQATTGFLNGGGADPVNPATWSAYPVNSPFQATACNKLGFKPTLHTRLFGGHNVTQRAKHPKLRAILETREGDANVLRSALSLPHALFLDQSNIRTVCTRPQLASGTCPKAAIYGHAQARSPLLGNPLRGPVYLVSSNHELPDLVADLRGQVNIQVHGVISSVHGGLKTVFNELPDTPVSKFILRMEGGKKGLLVNSRDLCKGPLSSVTNLKAQNGKKLGNKHLPLKVSGCYGRR